MEFYYDHKLAWKYSIGIISIIVTLILLLINAKIFVIPGIIFAVFGVSHTVGSYKMLIDIFTRRILVERTGVHFYYREKEEIFIPWNEIDDYSITEVRCILRVSGRLYSVNTQLENFEEFEQIIIDQLNTPKEHRGKKLPKIDTLPSLGGVPQEVQEAVDEEKSNGKLDYLLKKDEEGTGFRASEIIKEAVLFTGESPEVRLKKLNLLELVKDRYHPSYAGIQDLEEFGVEMTVPADNDSNSVEREIISSEDDDDDF